MFRETLAQIYFNAFLVFIIESSNLMVHIILTIFFHSFSYLTVLITFWGIFLHTQHLTISLSQSFCIQVTFLDGSLVGLPSGVFQKIVFSLLYFLTCLNIIIVSFTLTCCLSFISSYCFIFWFRFSSFFARKCVIGKPPLLAVFLALFTNILLTNLQEKCSTWKWHVIESAVKLAFLLWSQ